MKFSNHIKVEALDAYGCLPIWRYKTASAIEFSGTWIAFLVFA
jgi:hypothetical protein